MRVTGPAPTPAAEARRWRLCQAGLAAGCLAFYLLGAGGYDLLTDDETRYAEAGRRMVETGDWVVPEYNGLPRYQKPVLFYWLQALAQLAFGPTALAARLPTAVAGTARGPGTEQPCERECQRREDRRSLL